jgi:hypothetical protein
VASVCSIRDGANYEGAAEFGDDVVIIVVAIKANFMTLAFA